MSTPVIRRATEADCEGMCAAHLDSIRVVCARHYTPEQIESWCVGKTPDHYRPLLGRSLWFVADAGVIAGFGTVDPGTRGTAEVLGLYVASPFVGRGVGRLILARLLAEAAGARVITVKATLTAERFYRRAGFEPIARSSHESRGGLMLPCVLMRRALK